MEAGGRISDRCYRLQLKASFLGMFKLVQELARNWRGIETSIL